MQIDWFTFGAQVFNFVLLVWLLKRFLYRPVLNAIQGREERVRSRLDEARKQEEEARAEQARYEALQEELERTRTQMLRSVEEEAERRRAELTEEVREEVRALRREWQESLRRQKESFLEELRRRMSRELFGLVEKVLEELADAEVEDRLIDVFLDRLPTAAQQDREELVASARETDGRIRLRSSFPLTEDQHRRLEGAIRDWLGPPAEAIELVWEENPDMALGIELQGGDRKIAWSADDYLDVLQAETSALLEAETP